MAQLIARYMFQPILPFLVDPLDNLHFFLTCHKWAKSEKFGREFIVVGKWEPTSQVCSNCGFKWGKLDLKIRSVQCLRCQVEHDRDKNAAANINKVGMGYRHDSKWTQR